MWKVKHTSLKTCQMSRCQQLWIKFQSNKEAVITFRNKMVVGRGERSSQSNIPQTGVKSRCYRLGFPGSRLWNGYNYARGLLGDALRFTTGGRKPDWTEEKLSCDTVTIKASAQPMRNSEAGMIVSTSSYLGQGTRPLYPCIGQFWEGSTTLDEVGPSSKVQCPKVSDR